MVVVFALGCQHAPERVTWDDATPTSRAPKTTRASPALAVGGADDAWSRAPTTLNPAGPRIDRALTSFQARRVSLARAPRTSSEHGEAWLDVLRAIDEAVQVAPRSDDLGAFVRARVMLEVELKRDQDKRRLLPTDLDKRIRRTLGSVDQRVSELRLSGAPGTFAPPAPLKDGDLILGAPILPMVVSSGFGVRHDPIHGSRRFHAGVDVAAPEGTTIHSAAAGVVIYAGWQGGFGRHVVVDHGNGVRTHYSHMSAIWVKAGEILEEKQVVGEVGSSGRSTGPHLHFAVTNFEGRFIDPLKVLYSPFPISVIEPKPVALKR